MTIVLTVKSTSICAKRKGKFHYLIRISIIQVSQVQETVENQLYKVKKAA